MVSIAIEADELRKTFATRRRQVVALRGVDLSVPEGRIFGFLGPNGAGKTSVVRILTTLSRPDTGTARVAGFDVAADPREVRRRIGYISQAGGVDGAMTGRRNILLQARLQGMSTADAVRRADELIDRFGLGGLVDRPAATLSGGQNRRLALATGLVHGPSVYFLDEPTIGLDPHARAGLWQEVRRLREDGATVFLTTHYLDEAEALCDEVAIISQGRIVSQGAPAELKREFTLDDVVSLTLDDAADCSDAVQRKVSALPCTRSLRLNGNVLRVSVDNGNEALPILLRDLASVDVSVRSAALSSPSLNDVFLRQTGGT